MTQNFHQLDPNFDFTHAYKINAHTLVNIRIIPVNLDAISLTIDGNKQIISPSRDVYIVAYREFGNSKSFSLCKCILGKKEEMYWTSIEKAKAWLVKYVDLKAYGYAPLTQNQAFDLLRERRTWEKELRESLEDGL